MKYRLRREGCVQDVRLPLTAFLFMSNYNLKIKQSSFKCIFVSNQNKMINVVIGCLWTIPSPTFLYNSWRRIKPSSRIKKRLHLKCLTQFKAPQYKMHMNTRREGIQWRAIVIIVRHMMYKERLRELGLFCLKKLKQEGYFIDVFNHLLVQIRKIYPYILEYILSFWKDSQWWYKR